NGDLLFDVGQNGQNHRTAGRVGRNVFRLHCTDVAVTLFLGFESEKYGCSQLAFRIRQVTQVNTRQVPDTLVYATGIATHRIDDGIELAQLGQQHAAAEFVHAEIGRGKPAHSRLADHLLMPGPKSAQV